MGGPFGRPVFGLICKSWSLLGHLRVRSYVQRKQWYALLIGRVFRSDANMKGVVFPNTFLPASFHSCYRTGRRGLFTSSEIRPIVTLIVALVFAWTGSFPSDNLRTIVVLNSL